MFNEPEWMVEKDSTATKTKVSKDNLIAFTKACNKVIVDNGFKATVGSAGLKWSCTKGHWCLGDWWADTYMDFRTIHYYDWMVQSGNQFDPFSTKPSDWGFEEGE